jgi:hypothetical protein
LASKNKKDQTEKNKKIFHEPPPIVLFKEPDKKINLTEKRQLINGIARLAKMEKAEVGPSQVKKKGTDLFYINKSVPFDFHH